RTNRKFSSGNDGAPRLGRKGITNNQSQAYLRLGFRLRSGRPHESCARLRSDCSGLGGLMSITGPADGEPSKVGVAIIDLVAGLMLGKSTAAALFAREKLGVGQKIDTSLLEAEVACLINVGSNYLIEGNIPRRWGNAHQSIVPYQSFKTENGYLVIGV